MKSIKPSSIVVSLARKNRTSLLKPEYSSNGADICQTAVIVFLVASFFYARSGPLISLYANAPSRIESLDDLRTFKVKYADVVRNCEDAFLDPDEGFVLLSCDPGRDDWNTVMGTFRNPRAPDSTGIYIWYYNAGMDEPSGPEKLKLLDYNTQPEDFHPLGIEYHAESRTLFVVNHAESGSCVETFRLFTSEKAATHIQTLRHPLLASPNSITALGEREILVTNDHYFLSRYHPKLALLETYLGLPGGSVAYVRLSSGSPGLVSQAESLARLPFANGIVRLNSTTIAVASSSLNSVTLYSMTQDTENDTPQLTYTRSIPVPFHPDNLSVDGEGNLMIAGHPHAPTVAKIAESNYRCNTGNFQDSSDCAPKGFSSIAEWSEKGGLKALYVGDDFGTSTTAVRDTKNGMAIAVGLYEKGLLIWEGL